MTHFRINTTNYDRELITPEFIIIHYTGGTYQRVKSLFEDATKKVSSHFMIKNNGDIVDIVACKKGLCYRAWHAGVSRWTDGNKKVWNDLNTHSIGVELENLNGNFIEFTENQIVSLVKLCTWLINEFPRLAQPDKILGHEHIAGFRGKADPGIMFPWDQFYKSVFPGKRAPERKGICPIELVTAYKKFLNVKDIEKMDDQSFNALWHAINATLEKSIEIIYNGGGN